ncbi:MAG: putative DNA binding domain-containing protein [Chloroflexota bacterium]|nr:putative DNA binding domain-containing protein [Chloroflexota bacterium]
MDLHIHTPASADYEQPEMSFLDILHQAEKRALDIIAFTDHNSVAGYRAVLSDIEELEVLERFDRLQPEEEEHLSEYRRLLDQILLLPGFEFSATFGFHILGIFSPDTSIRQLEHLLLTLNIPPEKLDEGSTEVGATSDVLTAYRFIDEMGGIVIAAHVNSSHGVAMRHFGFGGQTKIAYTQDEHLHALEATDLEKRGRHTTMAFFNGSKPEYPRPMRCIQGSDAHRVTVDPNNKKSLGIGDRATEILLPEVSFEALREVFLGDDFSRTRPARPQTQAPFDHVEAAREQGLSINRSFHEGMTRRGGRLYAILTDVVAFANANGGRIYVGVSGSPKEEPVGVDRPKKAISTLRREFERRITPRLEIKLDVQQSRGRKVIRISVPKGEDPPYVLDESKIYIRQETETHLAVRDEIVQLVQHAIAPGIEEEGAVAPRELLPPPRTGVEIAETVKRKSTLYHTMRDLRNGHEVQNVTRASSRRLWHYAIVQKEDHPLEPSEVTWRGNIGLWKKYRRAGKTRYDLVQRASDGTLHVYYGVTEEGFHGEWEHFLEAE